MNIDLLKTLDLYANGADEFCMVAKGAHDAIETLTRELRSEREKMQRNLDQHFKVLRERDEAREATTATQVEMAKDVAMRKKAADYWNEAAITLGAENEKLRGEVARLRVFR
jgi:hypothetical protein